MGVGSKEIQSAALRSSVLPSPGACTLLHPESGSLVDPAARPSVPCCATGAHCIRCKCTYPASYFKAAVVSGEADPHPLSPTQPASCLHGSMGNSKSESHPGEETWVESSCTTLHLNKGFAQGMGQVGWFPASVYPGHTCPAILSCAHCPECPTPLPGQGRHLPL